MAPRIGQPKAGLHKVGEEAMSDPPRQAATPLEITVMYEPTRVASEVLHAAYAAVLPIPRRTTVARLPHSDDERPVEGHDAHGRAG